VIHPMSEKHPYVSFGRMSFDVPATSEKVAARAVLAPLRPGSRAAGVHEEQGRFGRHRDRLDRPPAALRQEFITKKSRPATMALADAYWAAQRCHTRPLSTTTTRAPTR
jgi:hypothetical protein